MGAGRERRRCTASITPPALPARRTGRPRAHALLEQRLVCEEGRQLAHGEDGGHGAPVLRDDAREDGVAHRRALDEVGCGNSTSACAGRVGGGSGGRAGGLARAAHAP